MATETKTDKSSPVVKTESNSTDALAAAVTAGVAAALAQQAAQAAAQAPAKKLTVGQYRPRTPFNPTGKKRRKLTHKMFQNGESINKCILNLYDEEITLLNKAFKPGRYFNNLVEVRVKDDGSGINEVHFNYKNTGDHRFAIKGAFRNMKEMLQGILDQQDA